MRILRPVLALVIAASSFSACARTDRQSATAAALQAILEGAPYSSAVVWSDVKEFYGPGRPPAWVASDGKVTEEKAVFAVLASAREHGVRGRDDDRENLEQKMQALTKVKDATERAALIADLDVRVTTALLSLGRDVAIGQSLPAAVDSRWKARRALPAFAATLATLVDHDLDTWLDRVRPQHPEYAALQQALHSLEGLQANGGWQPVPVSALTPGRANPSVVALRHRLAASGHLTGAAASSESPAYDEGVVAAVKAFQEHHTLKVTGVADAATLAAMNVPIDDRIRQVAVNLERWRWMPDDFGPRHLLVNIPAYHVVAREDGRDVMDIRVVVGKPGHETPVFSGEMSTVVFSPYWNIPDTIVEGETAPALARDPKYLERNHIEILRLTKSGTEDVNPKDVDWDDAASLKTLMFRQKPGPQNALGHVKFLFPNEYDVYLHDTPADALFSRTGRAFSHGCVRVEEPETMAMYVLRGDEDWSEPKILEAMNAGVEKGVKLKSPIPVHIVYFTTTVDEHGGVHFFNDVYGYDARQQAGTRKAAARTPES